LSQRESLRFWLGYIPNSCSNFNPSEGTFVYKRASYRISLLGIVQTSPVNTELSLENGNMVTYAAATEALKVFLETATEGEG